MSEGYYRVGQGAERLGISSHKVRQLCQTGLINAEFTGSQWRIPIKEVDRLIRDGIPPIPQNLNQDTQSGIQTNKTKSTPPLFGRPF